MEDPLTMCYKCSSLPWQQPEARPLCLRVISVMNSLYCLNCLVKRLVNAFQRDAFQVYNRRKKRLVEVIHDGKIVLSVRAIYQSKFGLGLKDTGAKEILQNISEKQGKKMDTLDSAKDIPKFVEFF
nr:phosphatidylserine decarboxylase proenzyme 2-like [Ipomoea batatas]